MPLRRTAAALAVVALSAALIAGCSKSSNDSDPSSNAPLPDATTLVQQSQQATRNVTSAHVELTVEGKIEGLPIKTLSGDLENSPQVAAKGNTSLTSGGDNQEAEFVVLDGKLYGSFDPGQWLPFGDAANIYDVSLILNPDMGLANVLANLTDPKAVGRETINKDVKTVKITGTVSPDTVKKLTSKLDVSGPTPTTVWIREDGGHDLVQVKLQPSDGNSIQMTLSNWNQPVSVEKPPGV